MTSTTPTNSPKTDHNQSDEIDIGQLVGLLVDRWVLIALTTALAAFMGIFYAFSVTPVFQADALVQVEEEKQGLDVAAMLGGDLATGGSSTKAEVEIIQSRMVLGDAVARTATDVVVTARRMPVVGNFLTNLGFVSGPFSSDYGFSWAADNINVTRFDVPDYALNLPHLIEFTGSDQFSLILDGATILDGRVGKQATGPRLPPIRPNQVRPLVRFFFDHPAGSLVSYRGTEGEADRLRAGQGYWDPVRHP